MDSILITKIVTALVYPLGLIFVLGLLRFLMRQVGASRWPKFLSGVIVSVLVLTSNPQVASWLVFQLEAQYPQLSMADVAEHDAIIVLGGGVRIPLLPARHTQLSAGSDRYWYAVRLYRAGKAKKIILAGGNVYDQPGFQGEAYYANELLQEWGVPSEAILVEDRSRTTRENQSNTALFLARHGIRSALLVTSAMHMPRAHGLFSKLPVPITPASADVLIREKNVPGIMSWIPSAAALHMSTVALHEYYGAVASELKDFIDKL